MSWEKDLKLLEDNKWVVECQSPFEIRKEGDFASGEAAHCVLESFKEKLKEKTEKVTMKPELRKFLDIEITKGFEDVIEGQEMLIKHQKEIIEQLKRLLANLGY